MSYADGTGEGPSQAEWSGILKVESTNTQKSGIIKKTRKEKEEMATYSKEFKAEALRLSDEIGVKKAAEQLGIPYFTLADWRSSRKEKQQKTSEMSEEDIVRRNRELEKENAELRQANEILKDALGFFAKDRKK